MKVLVISGFLGSGKTTILMDLARYLVAHSTSDSPSKVAIIENEVGEVGVDDKLLSSAGYNVENLFAGCVCCTLTGSLLESTKKIQDDMDPDWLILETTGIAYPESIRDLFVSAFDLTCRILILVDGARWQRLKGPMSILFEGQLECADVTLVNKCDLIDDETRESVVADVKELNDHGSIYCISVDDPLTEDMIKDIFAMD